MAEWTFVCRQFKKQDVLWASEIQTYLNTAAAADLRGRVADEVSFGGITFRRYRGGVGFTVPTDKAFFYPEGIEGLFEIYWRASPCPASSRRRRI